MHKFIASLQPLALFCLLLACSCSYARPETVGSYSAAVSASAIISAAYDSYDNDQGWNSSKPSFIKLDGKSIFMEGSGGIIDGRKVAITAAGTYFISGTLNDGQIVVKAGDDAIVKLVLNNANISSSTASPIYIYNSKKTIITLAQGTENYVTDGEKYAFADSTEDEPNAAIFSKDDLTINGNGSLTVNANYYNGIQCKDNLKITGGSIVVNALNDGIKGRDLISIKDASITINSGADGIQSNNEEDTGKGNIIIESGTLDITSKKDGIQAASRVVISGGNIKISSGGGSAKGGTNAGRDAPPWFNNARSAVTSNSTPAVSAKGIKAGIDITIAGGILNVDSADDCINTNDNMTVSGGNITLSSGDDGLHADTSLYISGGDISIAKCYEGLESSAVTITGGIIHITSSDDGINIVGENDGFGMMGPMGQNAFQPGARQGQTDGSQPPLGPPPGWSDNSTQPMGPPPGFNNFTQPVVPPPGQMEQEDPGSTSNQLLNINGGYLVIDAGGDGIDVNGTINMTSGTVIVNGPTDNGNGALDHTGFVMTGGFLVAAGSSGMAQAPGTSSNQYSVMVNLPSSQPAGTLFNIRSNDGKEILTFAPAKSYQSVVFSSPELKKGESYTVYTGGSSNGTPRYGLYSDGTYSPGTEAASFTISSIVTTIGSAAVGSPWGGGNMNPPGAFSENMTPPTGFGNMPRPGSLSDNMTRPGRTRR